MRPLLPAAVVLVALAPHLAAQAGASAPATLPAAPGAHVVTISAPEQHGNEPGIAVNPRDPLQVLAVYQGEARVAWSHDGGATFTTAEGTAPAGWRVAGDVSTTFDAHGRAYLSCLVFDSLGTTSYWAHGARRNGILVRRSDDGGRTWAEPVAVRAFPTGREPDIEWEDMPRIFADNQPHSPYAGNVYEGWIEWRLDSSVMLFARSSDGGRTWSAPLRVSTHAGLPRDDNGALVGFVGTVAPDGTIYAVWNDASTIVLTRSSDGGHSFEPSRVILQVGPPYFGGVPGVARVMGFPQVAVGPKGELYVAWSDYRNGDIDVFLARSADHGRTWSEPLRVNDDPLHDGLDQFFQFLAVDPQTGAVFLQFYDRRADPANRATRVTVARSTDGGRTFVNYAWTETAFSGRAAFLGDYTWLTAFGGKVYGIWTEVVPLPGAADAVARPGREATVVRVGTADFSTVP